MTKEKYQKRAKDLFNKLQKNCNRNTMKENYGEKQVNNLINKFEKETDFQNLSYSEQNNIKEILYKVNEIILN